MTRNNEVNDDVLKEVVQEDPEQEIEDIEASAEEEIQKEEVTEENSTVEQPAEQAEDANTKYMRLAADFQNYKKRTEKERFERYTEGKKDLTTDLLVVLDNFDRAMQHEAEDVTDKQFFEGMQMIFTQLLDVLKKNSVEEIEALGADFDPNMHHAVIMEPSEEHESGKVSEVMQKGYTIQGKVIRPSMVKVAE